MDRLIAALTVAILALASNSCKLTDENREEEDFPNVIIILADDQGWGDLGVNGNTNLQTPNIDRLAASGASFEHFYVCAVCSPTRAEMLTGRYHPRSGIYHTSAGGERMDLDETTMAEIFQSAGYATAAFGKWHNGMQYPYHPNARGFDEFYGFCSGHWGNYFSPMLEHNGELVRGTGFVIDDFTDHAIDFMEQHQDEPFFIYLPYNTPHSPMQVPDRWWTEFADKELDMRHRDPEKEDVMHIRAALAMCENIDWNVGRLVENLESLDLAEETIILYLSDNGPNGWRWNGGMKGRKGHTDEGGVRSPLFMRWTGTITAGKTISEIAGAIDLMPTLLDLAGIVYQSDRPIDGISLRPLILEDNAAWEDRMIVNNWRQSISIRTQKYRLDKDNQLFNMEADPGQTTDISEQVPKLRDSLVAAKERWRDEVLAELPEEDTRPFPVGHPDFQLTQLPARDGIAHGNIERSNRYPNCSFYTNWLNTSDKITWNIDVLQEGDYEVTVYYTCPEENTGSVIELSFGASSLQAEVTEAHDPPLRGMENDRTLRTESYVKDFLPLHMGHIHLAKGTGTLSLHALSVPGKEVMDFRLMMLKRL